MQLDGRDTTMHTPTCMWYVAKDDDGVTGGVRTVPGKREEGEDGLAYG